MSESADVRDHRLSVSGVLLDAVRTVWTAPLWFLAAALFAFIPVAYRILHYYVPIVPFFDKASPFWELQGVKVLFDVFTYAVMVRGAYGIATERPVSVWQAVGVVLRRAPSVVIATVLTTIIIAIGWNVLVVPGFFALLLFFVTVPVCLIEKAGPLTSMGRSIQLTRNARLKILGAWLVIFIPTALAFYFTYITPVWAPPYYVYLGIDYVVFSSVIGANASLVAVLYRNLADPHHRAKRETVTQVFA